MYMHMLFIYIYTYLIYIIDPIYLYTYDTCTYTDRSDLGCPKMPRSCDKYHGGNISERLRDYKNYRDCREYRYL